MVTTLYKYRVRLLLLISSILLILTIGMYTDAKYKWKINGIKVVQAGEYYFNSNYLKEHDGLDYKTYTITGWNGDDVTINIDINNYDNAILCNKDGQDINYNMKLAVDTSSDLEDYPTYSVTCYKNNRNAGTARQGSPLTISGEITGDGTVKSDIYRLTASKSVNTSLSTGDKVTILLRAYNSEDSQFYGDIAAKIELIMTDESSFITLDSSESEDLSVFYMSLRSGAVPGFGVTSRHIYVWYDTSKFRVNQFSASYNELASLGNISTVEDNGVEYGVLEMDMDINSLKEFQFYKNSSSSIIETAISEYDEFGNNQYIANNINYTQADGYIIGYYIEPLKIEANE